MARHSSHSAGTALPYGDARQALIDATVHELATKGPRGVVLAEICLELDISPALVNYHFGNRDNLLAEAVVVAHRRLVDDMNEITLRPHASAEDQFRARFDYRFDWTRDHPGIDSMLNYTHVLDPSGRVLSNEFQERIGQTTSDDMAGLATCVAALHHGRPMTELIGAEHPLYRPEFADVTAYVALSALGAATFLTGHHPGSTPLATRFPALIASLRDDFTTRIMDSVRNQLSPLEETR
ncbi:MAG: helix-turn-helix domain containing protein [Actinomycetota bacterium]|jgi:AcrR family transcriptional regulator|nr:helix-turn-helix domain containing protein [Actinomycetota bacterium]MDA3029407.1 helix-turn-helix domain containing protein [Actinomycetota bacterium]